MHTPTPFVDASCRPPDTEPETAYTPQWVYAGSSISGIGYGASIVTDIIAPTITFGVRLSWRGIVRVQPVTAHGLTHPRTVAAELMEAFCHIGATWNAVENIRAAHARGIATIGG